MTHGLPGDTENTLGPSDLTWLFGQFIDHDIDLSEGGDEAFDIDVPTGDAWFDPFGTGEATIGPNRTDYVVGEDGVRQQFNEITAFIDGSVIYGSDQERPCLSPRLHPRGRSSGPEALSIDHQLLE